jgi:hypothetical protein
MLAEGYGGDDARSGHAQDSPWGQNNVSYLPRPKVLVSYSTKDILYARHIIEHIKPLDDLRHIELLIDDVDRPTLSWARRLQSILPNAVALILVISPSYIASGRLMPNWLPRILSTGDPSVLVLPVLIRKSSFSSLPHLADFMPVNPNKTLNQMRKWEQDELISDEVTDRIAREVGAW